MNFITRFDSLREGSEVLNPGDDNEATATVVFLDAGRPDLPRITHDVHWGKQTAFKGRIG